MRNKYIYIVIRKTFYKSADGKDVAIPTDYLDIHTFSNMKKAEGEVKYRTILLQHQDNIPFQECDLTPNIITDCTKVYKFYAQQNYNTNGLRYAFVILKQVLE